MSTPALTATFLSMMLVGCCSASPPSKASAREVCAITSGGAKGEALPRLYRLANAHQRTLGPGRNLCAVPLAERALADRCESVDDLSALLGTGKVCGPIGVSTQKVCPSYANERVSRERSSIPEPLCKNGCPNVELSIREASGSLTRVAFYDDPLCHRAAEPGCEGSEQSCYYRVLALTSELR